MGVVHSAVLTTLSPCSQKVTPPASFSARHSATVALSKSTVGARPQGPRPLQFAQALTGCATQSRIQSVLCSLTGVQRGQVPAGPSSYPMPLAMSRQKPWRGGIGTHLCQFSLSPFCLSSFFFPLSPGPENIAPRPPRHLPPLPSSTWEQQALVWQSPPLGEPPELSPPGRALEGVTEYFFLILKGI